MWCLWATLQKSDSRSACRDNCSVKKSECFIYTRVGLSLHRTSIAYSHHIASQETTAPTRHPACIHSSSVDTRPHVPLLACSCHFLPSHLHTGYQHPSTPTCIFGNYIRFTVPFMLFLTNVVPGFGCWCHPRNLRSYPRHVPCHPRRQCPLSPQTCSL